ncbi:hypothetical protein GH5_06537 [Leishmania sp. Ghana 2012 LV757]|uniref:hypothetical protein n=1 Tax=Leishmania sp. Ghana 2012 LV757 TaxID=2803181 RepID=UPI001B438ACB|nr:hypothetical protein GH5_06537 [Leishmania sp. Ghana 2012 LV757]
MASPPPPALGCEQPQGCTFSMHCKRSLHPTLTHQFVVTWPWPVLQRKGQPRVSSGISAAEGVVGSSATQQEGIIKEEDEEEEEGEEGMPAAPTPGSDASAAAYSSVSALWRERRRYGRPTFVLDLSSDPFLGRHETRRASVLLSPGYRCLLPFVELSEPEQLPDRAGVAFWRTVFKPPSRRTQTFGSTSSPSAARSPPYCAELVVGELSAIERVVRERHEMATATSRRHRRTYMKPSFLSHISLGPGTVASPTPLAAAGESNLATGSPDIGSQWATREEGLVTERAHGQIDPKSSVSVPSPPSQRGAAFAPKTVLAFFFYTIPFRIRWLSQLPGRIVVSLPCEERLLTLHAPHGDGGHDGSASTTEMIAMSQVHSYALPRGVIPLDISEVFDRPFLAVGTAEHGVLLCQLDTSTGAIQGIARWISLRGYGSSLFPVTRLAAVFPARQLKRATDCSTAFPSPPSWTRRADLLESLNDGVLVCSSPYEPMAAVVKLGAAAEGVVEDFFVLHGVDTILDVGATVQPALGPLACTVSRKLLRFRVIDSATEEAERRTATLMKRLDSALADRVSPCLTYDRMTRLEWPLLHVAASPAVLQSFTAKYVSRRSYTKHWQFAVDSANRVVLLDRTVSQYTLHSTFQLCRCGWAAEEGLGAQAGTLPTASPAASGASERQAKAPYARELEGALGKGDEALTDDDHASTWSLSPSSTQLSSTPVGGQKRPRSTPRASEEKGTSGLAAKRRRPATVPFAAAKEERDEGDDEDDAPPSKLSLLNAFASAIPIEDACSGVVVTCVQDQAMQVAAAHDRNCISLVTWRIRHTTPPAAPSTSSPASVTVTTALAAHAEAGAQPS